MAKKHRIHPQGSQYIREAVPSPREVAAFVAPRTMEDGLSIANIFGDAAEMTPFAGAVPYAERELGLRDYSDEDVLLSAILGFPILGKFKNLKEALGSAGWASFKNKVKNNKRKLYSSIDEMPLPSGAINSDEILSSRARVGATRDRVDQPGISTVMGPTRGGTNLGVRSEGQQAIGTNTIRAQPRQPIINNGKQGYGGDDMYSPLRQKVDSNIHGPWRTDLSKADKPLQDIIAKNEDKWQFYVDDALKRGSTPERAENMALEAINMGRPDIADKIRTGQKSGRNYTNYKPYNYYVDANSRQFHRNTPKFIDAANRQTEKALREQFAMIPDELKQEFSQRYGTWDLFQDWQQNPTKWAEYQKTVDFRRRNRNAMIRYRDKQYGRDIER